MLRKVTVHGRVATVHVRSESVRAKGCEMNA